MHYEHEMMKTMLVIFLVCFVSITELNAEEFNLFGEAGQAYSIEVNLGHPHQKLHLLVDTGSTTLAVASRAEDSIIYYQAENSSSFYDTFKEVQARYSQGMWSGKLVSDVIGFPSLQKVHEVRTDLALITKSQNFFVNGSGWQGLLGLAYLPVGAWGNHVLVESWLDSLDRMKGTQMSFQMKLCGPLGESNATHYGKFNMLDDQSENDNHNKTFKTPILRKRWYEVGILSVRVITSRTNNASEEITDSTQYPNEDMCQKLNAEKSIVDSGTTNIRVPEVFFRPVVDILKNAAKDTNVLILDDFWYHGEAACWPEPQEWNLPWLAIDLLSDESDSQYFTLEIPSQNYMRVVKARKNTGSDGVVSEYCYKLGLEAGNKETVLGYTAMEGFEVTFNRSAGWIGFQTSSCGADTRISGPHNASVPLRSYCSLFSPTHEVASSIKAAQWALFAVSIVASGVLIYLLAPCVKMFIITRKPISRSPQISLSQAALVEQEN